MADKIAARLLRKSVRATSTGGTYDDLEIGPVPDNEEWFIRQVVSVDETNAITKRGQAIKSGGHLYWIDEDTVTTAGLRHGSKIEVLLQAGERLVVRLTGCTASDILKAWVIGQYWELAER